MPLVSSFEHRRLATVLGVLAALLLGAAGPARAIESQPQNPQSPAASTPSSPVGEDAGQIDAVPADTPNPKDRPDGDLPAADSKNRIFGVVPNYTTIEGFGKVPPITSAQSFKLAALDSFDPFVYPLFGFVAGVAQLQGEPSSWSKDWPGYAKRYGLAFADNTLCSLITTGLMPSLLKQDPRYYQGRASGFFPRLAYAASRSVVTRSRSGHPQFNLSEVGGTLIVANVANMYYPPDERNMKDTLERWGSQAMWDTVANELKEFWPDIRRMLHGL